MLVNLEKCRTFTGNWTLNYNGYVDNHWPLKLDEASVHLSKMLI